MALNKSGLISALTGIFEDLDPSKTAADKAGEIANAIDTFVKSGTVTTSVTVTSVSGVTTGAGVSGPGTGTGTGTIS
jgi:hypothetical protein